MSAATDIAGWDAEIELIVTVQVRAQPGDGFEGWAGRKPVDLAIAAVELGSTDPQRIDGYADLTGRVDIESIEQL